MAQNITLMGASYSAVPAVTLPKTGGGIARFDDASITTATASDVASGKLFLASDGTITTGTNSGGGGGSDVVFFEFTTNSTAGVQEVTVPYTGNGYPIVFAMNCDDISIRTTASGKVSASLYVDKVDKTTAPNYSGSDADKALMYEFCRYNGTSSATRFTCLGSGSGTDFFNASNPTSSDYAKVRMQSKNKFKVYISTSTSAAGLKAGTKYVVFIKYSE